MKLGVDSRFMIHYIALLGEKATPNYYVRFENTDNSEWLFEMSDLFSLALILAKDVR